MKILGLNISRQPKSEIKNNVPTAIQGWNSSSTFGNTSTWNRTTRSDFANNFASVNQIMGDIFSRKIYPVDDRGDKLPLRFATGWWALQHPNDRMGFAKFISTLVAGYLVLPELNVLVWHRESDRNGKAYLVPGAPDGQEFAPNTIAGFTILPRGSRWNIGGEEKFRVVLDSGVRYFERRDVITLKYAILPDDGYTGVSPGSASHNEAQITDYLAQQQRAFFEKGATPTLQVTIHARNAPEANILKRQFQESYRGASNSGGTIFQTVISDGIQGDGSPQIEVETLSPTNQSLAVDTISTWAQGVIDANQGVSPVIYGKVDAASFDTEKTARARFYAQTDAVLSRFLSDLKFELDRIVGGDIGWDFGFEVRNIEVASEQKVIADTRVANMQAFTLAINSGATPAQAQAALALPADFAKMSSQPAVVLTAKYAPQPAPVESNKFSDPVNILPISQTSLFKSADASTGSDVDVKNRTGAKTRVADRRPQHIASLTSTLTDFAKHKILSEKNNNLTPSDQKYINSILAQLQDLADEGGVVTARQLAQQIKGQVVTTNYDISQATLDSITARAQNVLNNFSDYIDEQSQPNSDGVTPTESIMLASLATGAIASRINMLAAGESHNAFQQGQLDNAQQIGSAYNVTVVKTWSADGSDPCEFCQAMNGVEAGVSDSFIPNGVINGSDGSTMVLDPDYSDGSTPDAHANCQCTFAFSVEDTEEA